MKKREKYEKVVEKRKVMRKIASQVKGPVQPENFR
jgi:hypothetical protein